MGLNWSDKALRARLAKGWRGGLKDGTPCGSGSTMAATQGIRATLPALLQSYGVQSVCDAGAGDMHWIRHVELGVPYRAFDLYPRVPGVTQLDITCEVLPECDLILCRHVLIHLDPERITRALVGFRVAAPLLLASQYDNAGPFDPSKQYNPTNLIPLLGEPIERLEDAGSSLALWKL